MLNPLSSEPVTLVIAGSVGSYYDYEVLRHESETNWNDMKSEYVKIIQTTEDAVVAHLEEHGVDHDREWATYTIEDRHDAEQFLGWALYPERQDGFIQRRTGHWSARVEGCVTDTENHAVEVEYTFIPGL